MEERCGGEHTRVICAGSEKRGRVFLFVRVAWLASVLRRDARFIHMYKGSVGN